MTDTFGGWFYPEGWAKAGTHDEASARCVFECCWARVLRVCVEGGYFWGVFLSVAGQGFYAFAWKEDTFGGMVLS